MKMYTDTGTAIAALRDTENAIIYIIADTNGSNDVVKYPVKNSKIFKKGDLVLGVTGSFLISNVLENKLQLRSFMKSESVDDYIYNYLQDRLVSTLRENHCIYNDNNIESLTSGGNVLIVIKDRIFVLQNNLSIIEYEQNFVAIGSGTCYLEASIATQLLMGEKDYKKILINALKITSTFVLGISSDYKIIKHEYNK